MGSLEQSLSKAAEGSFLSASLFRLFCPAAREENRLNLSGSAKKDFESFIGGHFQLSLSNLGGNKAVYLDENFLSNRDSWAVMIRIGYKF